MTVGTSVGAAPARGRSVPQARLVGLVAVGLLAALPLVADDHILTAFIVALHMIYMAQCWNIAAGYAGLFSLGHSVFVGIGAYTSTMLLVNLGVTPWLGAFAGAALAAAVGAALALAAFLYRVRGTAFAVLTLGAMEVSKGLAQNWDWIEGAVGINITLADAPGQMLFFDRAPYFYVILALVLAMVLLTWRLERSRFGQYLLAIREDEDAAEASGIDTRRYKVLANAMSAALTALAGTFYAQLYLYITPDTLFVFEHQLNMMLGVMVGGAGTILGPVLGSALFSALAELLRNLPFEETRTVNTLAQMVYAILLMGMMLFLPGGLLSLVSKRLRKHATGGSVSSG